MGGGGDGDGGGVAGLVRYPGVAGAWTTSVLQNRHVAAQVACGAYSRRGDRRCKWQRIADRMVVHGRSRVGVGADGAGMIGVP